MNTTTTRTAEAQGLIDMVASTINLAGRDVQLATSTVVQLAQRIGLLEGHLQCRDFSAFPTTKANIEAELADKKQALKEMLASLCW